MPGPVQVVLNPTAGGGAARRRRSSLEARLAQHGVDVIVRETEGPGHAKELARSAVREGASKVIAAGGDGTIHEVVNGLLAAADAYPIPALGVLPIGSGNDFAKLLGNADPFETVVNGDLRRFDVGHVEWQGGSEYFVNGMGTGIDVEVVRQIRRFPRVPGVVGYLLGLAGALVQYRPIALNLSIDGRPMSERVMLIAVSNGFSIGGGFKVCPDAEPWDGRLDICIVRELGLVQIVRVLPRVMRGTHARLPAVWMDRAREVEIEAVGESPLYFQLDGELREPVRARRLTVRVVPGALPVLISPATSRPSGQRARAPGSDADSFRPARRKGDPS